MCVIEFGKKLKTGITNTRARLSGRGSKCDNRNVNHKEAVSPLGLSLLAYREHMAKRRGKGALPSAAALLASSVLRGE